MPVCDGIISAISFTGNHVTLNRTLEQRIDLRVGQRCSAEDLSNSRQAIMNTGLFQSVDVSFDEDTKAVGFNVTERHYILPLPRISRNADGEVQLGGQLRFDNVRGLNHKFKLSARRELEEDGKGNAGNRVSARYEIPQFLNTDLGASVSISGVSRTEDSFENAVAVGVVKRREHALNIGMSKYLQSSTSLQGWRVDVGASYTDRDYQLKDGSFGTLVSGTNAELRVKISNNQLQLDEYRRRGSHYGAVIAVAKNGFLSDFSYVRLSAYYRLYFPLVSDVYENINVQLRVGAANRGAFGEPSFHIGGSSTLRGFSSDVLQGERMAVANVEYLRSFKKKPGLRWAMIMDFAAVKNDDPWRMSDIRGGVGGGLRWKIRSFVNTDLKLDIAYGLGDGGGDRKVYFGTSVVF